MDTSESVAGRKLFRLDTLPSFILIAVAFLLPVFFLPTLAAPFQFTKALVAIIGILAALFIFIISRLRSGNIVFPGSLVVAGGWSVAFAYVLSGLFATDNLSLSFVGQRFEVDTVVFMVMMALLLSIVPLIVRTRERIVGFYLAILLSAAVLALYQLARLFFGPDFLSFDIFTAATSNLLGRWNELAVFFGLIVVLSLMLVDGIPLGRGLKIAVYAVLVAALFFLAVINFVPVWIAVALFSLGMFVYGFLRRRSMGKRADDSPGIEELSDDGTPAPAPQLKVSLVSLFILVVSIGFLIEGASLNSYLASIFDISQLQARPSWTTTIEIAGETYKSSPVFGAGPNTFREQWELFKPLAVNETVFWNTNFNFGVGTIPTSLVTTGALGALAWAAFLMLFLYIGFRALVMGSSSDGVSYQISLTAFIAAVYLWILSVLYVTDTVTIFFAFLFTGLFLASLRFNTSHFREFRVLLSGDPRLGFVSVLLLTVVLILTVVGLYSVGQRYVSAFHFQRGVIDFTVNGNIEAASANVDRALLLNELDLYYRLMTQIGLGRLSAIAAATEGTIEERRANFQQALATTIRHGQRATEINPQDFQNWVALGRVYQAVVPLRIEGAYDSAKNAFERAQAVSPSNPALSLALAELEIQNGDLGRARARLDRALELKSNYTAAIFTLAQLQIQAGETQEALRSVEAATLLVPNNPVLFFQLGLLRFNNGDNEGAVEALERAVALNSNYANARYFLGLSYQRLGRTAESVQQFEVVEELNPDNREVGDILTNLRAGRRPFEGLEGAEDIEGRDRLPIEGE